MIDWSSAPEGATHAGINREGSVCWYKLKGAVYDYMHEGAIRIWYRGIGEPTNTPLVERPVLPEESRTDTHYNNTLRVPVTQTDAEKGYVEVKLDPYIVQRTCNVTDPVLQHIHKKAQRGTAKGHTMLELLNEIKQSAERGIELEEMCK